MKDLYDTGQTCPMKLLVFAPFVRHFLRICTETKYLDHGHKSGELWEYAYTFWWCHSVGFPFLVGSGIHFKRSKHFADFLTQGKFILRATLCLDSKA